MIWWKRDFLRWTSEIEQCYKFWGILKVRNTEIGLVAPRNSEKFYIFKWILEIKVQAETEISYFDRYQTDILK